MFCKYCGNPIDEGQVCSCPEAAASREAAAAKAPATRLGHIFQGVPKALQTLANNSEGSGISLPSTVILAVSCLVLHILSWVCLVGAILGELKSLFGAITWVYVEKIFKGIYGFGILGGLLTCLLTIALSMGIILIGQLLRKEKTNPLAAFITGTCVNVLPSALFLAGAGIAMLIPAVGMLVILVGIVAGLAADYKLLGKLLPSTASLPGGLIAASVVAVIFALMTWLVWAVIAGYAQGPLTDNYATVIGGSIEDLLSLLIGGSF